MCYYLLIFGKNVKIFATLLLVLNKPLKSIEINVIVKPIDSSLHLEFKIIYFITKLFQII